MNYKHSTMASLFDGISGFPLAAERSEIRPVWASEIEAFPIKVSKIRFPDMVHLGDITQIDGAKAPPVDLITFGSPCQDLSVAGKRAGLGGARSGLFMDACRIIRQMREETSGLMPSFAVWENVPGAFSSNKGEDFHAVIEELAKIADETVVIPGPPKGKWSTVGAVMGDGWSLAWRVLDAQHWGVAQRRRRIFLVVDFAGESAPEILFKREGLRGHTKESRNARQGTAGDFENGPGESDVCRSTGLAKTMLVRCGCECAVKGALIQDDKSATISCNNDQTVFVPTAFGICSDKSNSMLSDNPHSGIYEAETSRTLDANGGNPGCNQGGIAVVALQGSMIGREDQNGPKGSGTGEDVSFTLNTIDRHAVAYAMTTGSFTQIEKEKSPTLLSRDYKDAPIVSQPAYGIDRAAFNQGQNALYKPGIEEEQQPTLTAKGPGAVAQPASFYPQMKAESQCFRQDGTANTLVNGTSPGFHNGLVEPDYIVRRLTPLECERLQGFPDGWTDIDDASDTARYKALGNSVAVPCVEFVLEGVAEALACRTKLDTMEQLE